MPAPSLELQTLKAEFFRALAHPVRIRLLEALAEGGEQNVQTLQQRLSIEQPIVSQPGPLSQGKTVAGRAASVDVKESTKTAVGLPSTSSVDDLVKALNLLGVGPRDLIAVLQAMKAAGAIDADLEVM